ncbi:MAG: outer membrane receptor for ferrienterochelin and colicins [Polaribacter sp.]|jgi:outer membrane receptor for ferrienterochelin and colicins
MQINKQNGENRKKRFSFVFAVYFIGFGSALAEDNNKDFLNELSLEDLLNITVGIATKTTEKSSLSPAIMTVITAQDISTYGYSSVPDALSHVVGFIDNYNLAMHNFGVRGINSGVRSGSRTIKFMLDGQAIAFRSTSQNFIDQELIPMGLIKRIEVIRGPASALYGANAFLAVVNIVTLNGSDLASGSLAMKLDTAENGGQGYQLDAHYGNSNDNLEYSIAAKIGSSERGSINLPRISPAYENSQNVQSDTDRAKPLSVYSRAAYQWDDNSQLKLSGYYQQLNVDNVFSDINPLQSSGATRIALNNMYLRGDYEMNFSDNISGKVYAVYSQGNTLDDDKIELGAENFFLKRRLGFDGLDFGAEVFISLRDSDSLLLGVDTKREHHKIETFTKINRSTGKHTLLNPNRNETLKNTGYYLQYLKQINENWRAIGGLRIDDDSILGQQSSFRFGLVGQLPYNIILKTLAGSSFQAPSPELLYRTAVQGGDIIGNPNLNAQQAKTYEISAAIPINKSIHMTLTYFNTQVDDLVVFTSDASNLFATNSAGSKTKGIEIEFRMLWQGINSYFNYSRQHTKPEPEHSSLFILEQRNSGEIYPEHAANFGLSYRWSEHKTTLSWNNRWVGSRKASSLNVLYINQFYELESYLDSSLTLSNNKFSLFKNKTTNIHFQVKDLFNTNYVNPGFGGIEFPSLGRRFLLSIEQHF